MRLADELFRANAPIKRTTKARLVELEDPPLRLPFNGLLSPEEQRIAESGSYDYGPVCWEPIP